MLQYKIIDSDAELNVPLEPLLARLPSWRREQALKFKHEQGQRECATAYLLLSEMLGFQPEFLVGEHGKPYIAPPQGGKMFFNISHCKAAIACAVSDNEVGIDAERIGRYSERLARYCMSDDELARILSADNPDAEFTVLWTKKEALLKLTGEGITDDMKSCLTSNRMNGVTIRSGFNAEKGYAYSVAYHNDNENDNDNDNDDFNA